MKFLARIISQYLDDRRNRQLWKHYEVPISQTQKDVVFYCPECRTKRDDAFVYYLPLSIEVGFKCTYCGHLLQLEGRT